MIRNIYGVSAPAEVPRQTDYCCKSNSGSGHMLFGDIVWGCDFAEAAGKMFESRHRTCPETVKLGGACR